MKLDQIGGRNAGCEHLANERTEQTQAANESSGQECSVISRGDHNRSGCHCQLESEKEEARVA